MLMIVYVHVKKGKSIPILSKFPCQYHDYMILRSQTTTRWCPFTKLLTITRWTMLSVRYLSIYLPTGIYLSIYIYIYIYIIRYLYYRYIYIYKNWAL